MNGVFRKLLFSRIALACSLLFIVIIVVAQISPAPEQPETSPDKIFLEHADELVFDKDQKADVQVLVGNVEFRHQTSYMFCDSAYFYELSNSLEAFGNVRMEQGDTIFVYGDYLIYNGNTSLAELRDSVRMINNDVTLYTDSLNYDRVTNIGYYFNGGTIVDEENTLYSLFGQYSPATKLAFFKDSVYLKNPRFDLYSDTLTYNTTTKFAEITGPTEIISDSTIIYSTSGWYNTLEDLSVLLNRSVLWNGTKSLIGDSIAYDKMSGQGKAFGNVILNDTLKKVSLYGEYVFYDDVKKYAFATDSAMCAEYSQPDTLFLHADTISFNEVDTTQREIKAYHGVRFYRIDLQGVCDSMIYNSRDSILNMYIDPYLWNANYQLSGDSVRIFLNDSSISHAEIISSAFAIEHVDSSYYNQLRGSVLKAYFDGRQIRRIFVDGNAESIFYPEEKDSSLIGVNKTKSGFLSIDIKDNKLERLTLWPQSEGTLIPLEQSTETDRFFSDFNWNPELRPTDRYDIFRVKSVPENVKKDRDKKSKFDEDE
ncbi:MAG: OstA-like protein [Bacteroidales bacterium]|nr:OstA-like protein [Bacteroidales bacterium]